MRKLIFIGLMAAVTVPAAAPAQSRREIQRDRQDVQEERRELEDARRRGTRSDIREEREELRDARQELREDRRDRRARYVAPYRDWRYSTVRPGFQLRRGFYGTRYIISNPGAYRLRPAARNQQWIRYGDDLLLVNVRNGRVLQVLRNRYR